jgi:hypothetical protein
MSYANHADLQQMRADFDAQVPGVTVPAPGAGQDGYGWEYDHDTGAMVWVRHTRQAEYDAAFWRAKRTSEVSTMPRMLTISNLAHTSGVVAGWEAYCEAAGTYTKIRYIVGATAFSGVTEFRVGVWDPDGTLLAESANLGDKALNTVHEGLLGGAGVTLTLGQRVILGIAAVGGTMGTFRGLNIAHSQGLSFGTRPARSKGGWAGGTLGTLPDAGTLSSMYFLELIP